MDPGSPSTVRPEVGSSVRFQLPGNPTPRTGEVLLVAGRWLVLKLDALEFQAEPLNPIVVPAADAEEIS